MNRILELTLAIELNLFKTLFNLEDKGAKYTNKAKSIVFNIKVSLEVN